MFWGPSSDQMFENFNSINKIRSLLLDNNLKATRKLKKITYMPSRSPHILREEKNQLDTNINFTIYTKSTKIRP
uniref:Uncharacterized protein n=1 Tax=Oryza brachyantha TaxID=4533 RepID=J3LC22_ORYBR